jgi:hypothetical protein
VKAYTKTKLYLHNKTQGELKTGKIKEPWMVINGWSKKWRDSDQQNPQTAGARHLKLALKKAGVTPGGGKSQGGKEGAASGTKGESEADAGSGNEGDEKDSQAGAAAAVAAASAAAAAAEEEEDAGESMAV